jgi:hypothetical protein
MGNKNLSKLEWVRRELLSVICEFIYYPFRGDASRGLAFSGPFARTHVLKAACRRAEAIAALGGRMHAVHMQDACVRGSRRVYPSLVFFIYSCLVDNLHPVCNTHFNWVWVN